MKFNFLITQMIVKQDSLHVDHLYFINQNIFNDLFCINRMQILFIVNHWHSPWITFLFKVSEDHLCYSKPGYVTPQKLKFPSNNVLAALKSNLDVKQLQFQYIAVNSGLFINYPATKLTDCDSYDPRFRYEWIR